MAQTTPIRFYQAPSAKGVFDSTELMKKDPMGTISAIHNKLGIGFDRGIAEKIMSVQDSLQPTVTSASVFTPVQFLQEWLPGVVRVLTAKRAIDEMVGITTAGSWEDEQVVQTYEELINNPTVYGDVTQVPLASTNINFLSYSVLRFEQGLQVSRLDEKRASRVRIDLAGSYRQSAAMGLEIVRNNVGYFGFNGGSNRTYGFLTDPNLPNYINSTTGALGDTWNVKNYLEIIADLLLLITTLRTQSGDNIDPKTMKATLALPTNRVDYLSTTTDFGSTNTVLKWLNENYPGIRVVSAVQLINANSSQNVAYLYADQIDSSIDGSTDGGATWCQCVPQKFLVLGVEQRSKGYQEDYSMATAGTFVKRAYAVVRMTHI